MYEELYNTVHDLSYVYRLAWGMNCVFVYLGGCGNVQNPDISHNTLSVLIFWSCFSKYQQSDRYITKSSALSYYMYGIISNMYMHVLVLQYLLLESMCTYSVCMLYGCACEAVYGCTCKFYLAKTYLC